MMDGGVLGGVVVFGGCCVVGVGEDDGECGEEIVEGFGFGVLL